MSLGRGLSSLIPPKSIPISEVEKDSKPGVFEVLLSKIIPNPNQPRKMFSRTELEELTESIKQYGVLQPLLVIDLGNDVYELVAGERRFRASKLAGLKKVPVVLTSCDAQKKLEIALIENLQRENLNPIEEAHAYENLINEFSLKQDEVAKKMGKSRSQISNTLRLLNLPDDIQGAIQNKKIPSSSARLLVTMTPKEQELFLKDIINKGMTVRDIEKAKKIKVKKASTKDINLLSTEEDLREVLGTKVLILKRSGKGKIVIDFYSEEEFKELVKKLKSI